jgi:hypothetical protein
MNRTLVRSAAAATAALAIAASGGIAAAASSNSSSVTATYTAKLVESGGAKGSKAADGTFVGKLMKDGKMSYTITYKGVSGKLDSALIQVGQTGKKGTTTTPLTGKLKASPLSGTITPSKSLVTAFKDGKAVVWLKATKPTSALSGTAKA